MELLLDTHTVIWFIDDNPRLPQRIREMLEDDYNTVYVSMISLWEISIKARRGKLDLKMPMADIVQSLYDNYFDFLSVSIEHIYRLDVLPLHHKDPFDRMLIAQSLVQNMPLVGCDEMFDFYDVRRFW